MQTAKLFMNGRSQAVRLPKEFRIEGTEVLIKRTEQGVLLMPKSESVWDVWAQELLNYQDGFMADREQPVAQQIREGLDELFD